MRRGAWAWFHGVWTCGAKLLEYWIISSLKIKLNRSLKNSEELECTFGVSERSWWAGFSEIYLVRFGSKMWEILIFKWFLLLKIQINSPKTRVLEGKISWGRGNTWANGTGHTSTYLYTLQMVSPRKDNMTFPSFLFFQRSYQISILLLDYGHYVSFFYILTRDCDEWWWW